MYAKDGLAGGHVIMLGADDASKWVVRPRASKPGDLGS